jgi:hypothetical protein
MCPQALGPSAGAHPAGPVRLLLNSSVLWLPPSVLTDHTLGTEDQQLSCRSAARRPLHLLGTGDVAVYMLYTLHSGDSG